MNTDLNDAIAALQQGRLGDALSSLERAATTREVVDAWHWQKVVEIASRMGDEDIAILAARKLQAQTPRDIGRRVALAQLLGDAGMVREALTQMKRLEDELPDDPRIKVSRAVLEGRLGRIDEAMRAVRAALRQAPHLPIAWEILASLREFHAGDLEKQQLEQVVIRSPERPEGAGVLYALGKVYDDVDDIDRAFYMFARGASRILTNRVPRMDEFFREATDIRAAFPAERLQAGQNHDRPERPILVLGCPRSGTTLLERILMASDVARSGGELQFLRLACLGFTPPSPARVDALVQRAGGDREAWSGIAEAYVRRLHSRFGTANGVVDKGLVNFLYVGAAAMGLPQARMVLMRRDPMDVAWSCFRRRFHEGLTWSYHFDSIAAFLRVYQDTMDHWQTVLPGRILTVDYEQLVTDPDVQTARVFDFVGLERPADWRSFHERRGVVVTASQFQVRDPLTAEGIGAWRRYERHLGPLRDALLRHGVRGVSVD